MCLRCSRIIAQSGKRMSNTARRWHDSLLHDIGASMIMADRMRGTGIGPIVHFHLQRPDRQPQPRYARHGSNVDVQLQLRHDLVPQLVSTVQAYATHENATLKALAELRSREQQAAVSVSNRGQIEQQLGTHIGRLLALQEKLSRPQGERQFPRTATHPLVGIEDRLQNARGTYNQAVLDYNTPDTELPAVACGTAFAASCQRNFFSVTAWRRCPMPMTARRQATTDPLLFQPCA